MWNLMLWVLAVIFLLLPVFTYLIFWYEAANSVYKATLYRRSNGKPQLWLLRGILSSICTNVAVICFFPFGFVRRMWVPDLGRTKGGPSVVLVHGIYHNPGAWVYYQWRLKRKGYGRIYAFRYGSWKTGFWEIYQELETWMKRVEGDSSGEDIVLVGHSLGGLLAKTYAGRRGESGSSAIRRVITLGTPFKGSKMVVFGFGKLSASLQYQGPLVKELEQYNPSTTLPCVALYSPVDNVVLPMESLVPPPGWKKEEMAPLCHNAGLYHRLTFNRVFSYIEEGDSKSG
ncbi:MAG: alpha/beta fold hydrolase [Deltaproteobacteria bacterium]|jgi:pimeloyl-ACP methyl ester carboxylesterase|nr:alpha/beta fold hydrolase [Deltaproteobacteria bacterium]